MGKKPFLCAEFSRRLRALRKFRGVTMTALAKSCDLSQPTIRGYELAEYHPDLKTLELLARCLGTSPSWLAYGDGVSPLPVEVQS